MRYCIYEDAQYSNFLPLTYFRSVFDLRCGAGTLFERIQHYIPSKQYHFIIRPGLAPLASEDHPGVHINLAAAEDTWYINGRVIASEGLAKAIRSYKSGEVVLSAGDEIVAARIEAKTFAKAADGGESSQGELVSLVAHMENKSINCQLARHPWDLLNANAEEISRDFTNLSRRTRRRIAGKIYPGASLVNRKNILIGKGSVVKPGTVLDAEHGPIIIGDNVTIMPNAVIEGPACIGSGSIVKIGAKIYSGTSIGPMCKVGGEIEHSIIQSHSNKQHDGFLGHSYLGSWVNLGADTNTSDLKNTYSNIRFYINGAMIDSEQQFLGLVMGDHSKSGINTMFDTGTNVGVSCNVYGSEIPPKFVPSFSWGGGLKYEEYDLEKSLATARLVMARRNVSMSTAYEQLFRSVFEHTADARRRTKS
ncbi:MAG TPA: GlmU family protein [Bacteroidota bacterium]|nr:GlmU family protein [Bacteroidota bacterium]